jgi:diketogulonate reductase-like aldo/keto reductase
VPAMAYSPIEQGRLLSNPALRDVAERMKAAPAQVALAWALRRRDVIVILKASSIAHVRENRAAADLEVASEEIDALYRAFPEPRGRVALEML